MTNKISNWDLSPAPESTGHISLNDHYGVFIDGEFRTPAHGNRFQSINPSTGEFLAEITESSAGDVDQAVAAARKAFSGEWSKIGGRERGKYLYRLARMLQEKSREFAVIESLDGGKPIRESRDVDAVGGCPFVLLCRLGRQN